MLRPSALAAPLLLTALLSSSTLRAQDAAPAAPPEAAADGDVVGAPDAPPAPAPPDAGPPDAAPAADAATTGADASAAPPVAAPARVALSFMGIAAGDAERPMAARVDEDVRAALFADRGVDFAPAGAPLLTPDCVDDEACRIANAAPYETPWVLVGRLDGVDGALSLTLVLFARETGVVDQRVTASAPDADALVAQVGRLVTDALRGVHPSPPSVDEPPPPPPDEEPEAAWPTEDVPPADDDEEPAPRRLDVVTPPAKPPLPAESERRGGGLELGVGTFAYMGAFVVAGGVLAAGGAVFDLASPSSVNGSLDALDVVGPLVVTTGLALAATGIATGLIFQPFSGGDDGED